MDAAAIDILYEQGPCLAVNKPPGLLTQAPPGIDCLELRIREFIRRREGKTGNFYLGVPHRIDRPASGAIVFARHRRAAARLARQFERRTVDKVYWALVEGRVEPESGSWRDFVRKIPGQPLAEIVAAGDPHAREAVLRYRVLRADDCVPAASASTVTWLEIRLETGRTHQVRIQAASRGWPVLGDFQYGATRPFGPQYDDPRLRAIALHARTLGFLHPMTGEPVSVAAPPPAAWRGIGDEGPLRCVAVS